MLVADITLRRVDFDKFEDTMRCGLARWCWERRRGSRQLLQLWLGLPPFKCACSRKRLWRLRMSLLGGCAWQYLDHLNVLAVCCKRNICVYLKRWRPNWVGTGVGCLFWSRGTLFVAGNMILGSCEGVLILVDIKISGLRKGQGGHQQQNVLKTLADAWYVYVQRGHI